MKLQDKIINLRKDNGWSQEELAEKLNVSRQAVSRWESGSAQPDAANLLQLSRLFSVTTDYLLNDEYEKDDNLPKGKVSVTAGLQQTMFFMIMVEVMILIVQIISFIVLKNVVLGMLSFLPFVGAVGGFMYACCKNADAADRRAKIFQKRFYKISAWLGTYFPTRLVMNALVHFFPRPYPAITFECVIFLVYLAVAWVISRKVEKEFMLY